MLLKAGTPQADNQRSRTLEMAEKVCSPTLLGVFRTVGSFDPV